MALRTKFVALAFAMLLLTNLFLQHNAKFKALLLCRKLNKIKKAFIHSYLFNRQVDKTQLQI